MLRLANGITMDVINSLIYTSKVVIESESVIFSDFDYFANILENGYSEDDSVDLVYSEIFVRLCNKLNTGQMTTEDRQVLLAQLNSAYKLDDSDLADCKRQLVLVSGEFDCNKYYNRFFCIFMRWFVQEDGTKKIAPAQFVRVSVILENPKKHAETTNLFEEYKKIRNTSTNKSEAGMFLEKPNYLVDKSVNDVMICPYCNSNSECRTDISRPSDVDAELFSDNTGNYSVKCYCTVCMNYFDLNLNFRYELTGASSIKRY